MIKLVCKLLGHKWRVIRPPSISIHPGLTTVYTLDVDGLMRCERCGKDAIVREINILK